MVVHNLTHWTIPDKEKFKKPQERDLWTYILLAKENFMRRHTSTTSWSESLNLFLSISYELEATLGTLTTYLKGNSRAKAKQKKRKKGELACLLIIHSHFSFSLPFALFFFKKNSQALKAKIS